MSKVPPKPTVSPLSPKQAAELSSHLDDTVKSFKGSFEELESAIGMMVLGRLLGWKVLVLLHNKRTIRKYEEILGISVREAFPEEGPLASKSVAYEWVTKAGQFWKGVSGEYKVENRRELIS